MFSGNSASDWGSGMYNKSASPTLMNCTFFGNAVDKWGGGMYNYESSSPILSNCTFYKNSAGYSGGGMTNESSSSPILTNCTISGNSGGGGIYNYESSSPTLTNCIIWGNVGSELYTRDSVPVVNSCDIQGGWPGSNIDAAPLFANPANGDFHLQAGSPCIDAGNNAAPHLPTNDIDGHSRIIDGNQDGIATVDMGVDEYRLFYVDADATGSDNGMSWTNAYTDLQSALSAALSGDDIWVAAGTYKPSVEHGGTGERYKSFQLKNGVGIYGGFAGNETSRDQRDWLHNVTILSGNIGAQYDNYDNCYHVFYHPSGTHLDNTAILDGFTITEGKANGPSPFLQHISNGGGIYNDGSSPTLTNCTFSDNSATYEGGGMFNNNSSPTLTNCTFSGNSVWNYGGGMYNEGSSPTLTKCAFSDNSAGYGGGIYNISSSCPILTNCTFSGNSANYDGGGMRNSSSSPILTNCNFSDNFADYNGGGMCNSSSSPILSNCTFSGNSSIYEGGGMDNDNSSPTLTNCTFFGNSVDHYDGGGMENYSSSPTLTNCTFSGNSAVSNGGGMSNVSSSPILTNCILWGNSSYYGDEISNYNDSSPTVTYCDVQDGYSGTGNLNANPLFVNATNGNFHLQAGSPCIDAGNNAAPHLPATDFEGHDRILDGDGNGTSIVDMGVDEVRRAASYLLWTK